METLIPKTSYRTSPLSFVTREQNRIPTPASLLDAVQAAVRKVEESWLHPIAAKTGSPAFQPRIMLAVLTYCYARQTYGSSEILNYLIRDEAFCKVCQRELPSTRDLQSFRRENRSAIENCLVCALRYLGEQKIMKGLVTRIPESIIAEEAKRRIIMAACVDSMESGDDCFSW